MELTLFVVGNGKEQSLHTIFGFIESSLRVPKALALFYRLVEVEAVTHPWGRGQAEREEINGKNHHSFDDNKELDPGLLTLLT